MLTVETTGAFPGSVSRPFIERLARLAYVRGGGKGKALLTVAAVGDAEMRKLNKRHRGKDKVTDVLSFSYREGKKQKGHPFTPLPLYTSSLGDLVICIPQVKRQAKRIGRSVRDELGLMVVHGTLHLLGYDHESLADERRMFWLQHDILIQARIL